MKILKIWFPLMFLASCMGAGTHGSIKSYKYTVSKYQLQKAIDSVIKHNQNIVLDTVRKFMIDITNGKNDTIWDSRYNDNIHYISFSIILNDIDNRYVIHFYGDSAYWDTSRTSEISIAYAYDRNGKGGSEGHGDVTWYTPTLKKRLVNIFEKEFIEKIDTKLSIKHTEE